MQAALGVFAERGFHRATMQAVAERAGVSKGGVYAYFDSKEHLLTSTADYLFRTLLEPAMAAFESDRGPIHDRIRRFLSSLLEAIDDWTELCFSLLQVWAELGPRKAQPLKALMADLYRQSADRVQAIFDDAVTSGEARPFPTRGAALALLALLDGLTLQAIIAPDEFRTTVATGFFADWCASTVPTGQEGTRQ